MATVAQTFRDVWQSPPGLLTSWSAVNNRIIGNRFIATAFVFFLINGILALLMRTQLMVPENNFVDPETYNRLFTMHGTGMMFLYAVPVLEGFATYLIPLMIGSRDLPFPRLTAFGYWCYLFGGIFLFAGFFVGAVPDDGWFAYTPLSGPEYSPNLGMDFWLLGLTLAEIATIAGGIELIVAVVKLRAPGMSLNRIPILVWETLIVAIMLVLSFPILALASVFLELERKIGAPFFDPELGGKPLLWQHLFWIFAHPLVYIQFLPGAGILSMIIPVFARRRMVGYTLIILALVTTGFFSFGVWAHHMFATGLPVLGMAFFAVASLAVALPTVLQIVAWTATLWTGRPVLKSPLLFAIGFVLIFVIGGINGVSLAVIPFDWQMHDTYYVVSHLHYVLLGGNFFAVLAGIHYWFPKMTGRMLNERMAALSFWLLFIGVNLTFFPMHITGLLGMPRRIYTYEAGMGWALPNLVSTYGSYVIGLGILVFLANFFASRWGGARASDNPWLADTLEWATDSPPPPYGFRQIPIVHSLQPLWEQERLDAGDERTERIVEALEARPATRRATLSTTWLDAQPDAIVRLPGPTFLPLATAVAVTLIFLGLLIDSFLLVGLATVATVAAAIVWAWPNDETWDTLEPDAVVAEYGVPTNVAGPRSSVWWGLVILIAILAVILASLVASWIYLSLGADAWPPPMIELPEIELQLLAGALLLASTIFAYVANKGVKQASESRLRIGMFGALILALGFVAVELWYVLEIDMPPWIHAYAAISWAMIGFFVVTAAVGVIMTSVVFARALLAHFTAWRYLAVEGTALFWYFVVVTWLTVFATLYIGPAVL